MLLHLPVTIFHHFFQHIPLIKSILDFSQAYLSNYRLPSESLDRRTFYKIPRSCLQEAFAMIKREQL